jgi:hypothetical protein
VELLGDVRLDRVETQRRRHDAREAEHVVGDDDVWVPEDRIAERDVDTEGLPEGFPREAALGAKAEALVEHPVVLDLRMILVGTDLEGEEVFEIAPCRFLELREHAVGGADEPKVDILRRASALEAKLEDEATLEGRGIAKHGDDPGEKTIEDEELTLACEGGPRLGCAAKALLQRLLERFRGAVRARRHAASPPKGSSARSTTRRSAFLTRPRRTACWEAWRSRSGEIGSRAQSLRVRDGEVTGTGPNQARSLAGMFA